MLSRILWISVAGIAVIAGMAIQDGNSIFSWSDHDKVSVDREEAIEDRVERAIEGSFDKMQVVDSDGREIDVPEETERAMADAVGRLIKAEAEVAMARIGEDDEQELTAATARRDQARADIERLKAEIKSYERRGQSDKNALREQIRREVREDVRASVREAVAN